MGIVDRLKSLGHTAVHASELSPGRPDAALLKAASEAGHVSHYQRQGLRRTCLSKTPQFHWRHSHSIARSAPCHQGSTGRACCSPPRRAASGRVRGDRTADSPFQESARLRTVSGTGQSRGGGDSPIKHPAARPTRAGGAKTESNKCYQTARGTAISSILCA